VTGRGGWSALRAAAGAAVLAGLALAAAGPAAADTEPNNTPATAEPLLDARTPRAIVLGGIGPPGDVDIYRVSARAADRLLLLLDRDPDVDNVADDLKVIVFAPDGVTPVQTGRFPPNDDDGPLFSEGVLVNLTQAGDYFVQISHTAGGTGVYLLSASFIRESVIAVAPGAGGGPHVRTFEGADGAAQQSFFAYDPAFTGGVSVATCDLDGDHYPDLVTGTGPGGAPHVRTFSGLTGLPLAGPVGSFLAYDPGFTGGVSVACGDVDGDGTPDIVVGAGAGGGPHVRVFRGGDATLLADLFPYDPGFVGGVRVAAGDVTGDGRADIVTATGPGGGPHVRVFDGVTLTEVLGLFAYDPGLLSGLFVAVADVDADGYADIITGPDAGGAPDVRVFRGVDGSLLLELFAYDIGFRGGVRVAGGDLTGDGRAEILTAAGAGGGPHVRVLDGTTGGLVGEIFPYSPGFTGGLFVAAP
jgi:hypothetical protein